MLSVCRLCLAKDANFLISNGQVAVKILSCTGLEFDPNDKLPQLICSACRLRLEEFHYFRKRCHAADRRLRQFIRSDRNFDRDVDELFDGDKEDLLLLKDVAQCSNTACSESNSQWRRKAAEIIRLEMDAYKNDLLALCKQQVREEIELQVRGEVEEMLLAEAKKNCQLKVLDELFYEIETWFVNKRNNAVRSQALGSDELISENADLECVSTIAEVPTETITVAEIPPILSSSIVDADVNNVLDIEAAEENQVMSDANTHEFEANSTVPTATPMVEINMDNAENNHLRDEPSTTFFLTKEVSSPQKIEAPSKKPRHSILQSQNTEKQKERKCQIHSSSNQVDRHCYRCRLRGSHGAKKC